MAERVLSARDQDIIRDRLLGKLVAWGTSPEVEVIIIADPEGGIPSDTKFTVSAADGEYDVTITKRD